MELRQYQQTVQAALNIVPSPELLKHVLSVGDIVDLTYATTARVEGKIDRITADMQGLQAQLKGETPGAELYVQNRFEMFKLITFGADL